MQNATQASAAGFDFDRLWRFAVLALGTLILCSCRTPAPGPDIAAHPYAAHGAMGPGGARAESLPAEAFTGAPPPGYPAPPYPVEVLPQPYTAEGPWAPPGIARPWPADEYMFDGGDREEPTRVGQQWQVYGLHTEDTVAHFDTLDGRTLVEPSNRVHIYAPRFGAVRQVVGLAGGEQAYRAAGVMQPEVLAGPEMVQAVGASSQHRQAIGQAGVRPVGIYESKQGDGVVSEAQSPVAFQDQFLPYENLDIIRRGVMEAAEMAWLARGVDAAAAWETTQAVQVVLDHQAAKAEVQTEALQDVFTVTTPKGNPRLRVIKIASEHFAKPGDEVAFTIRFDNVGNQVIGNVTILDNLTTRLEYIPDSAQCSLEANFSTEPNEGGSVVLRAELIDPLEPGAGGVLRFRCRVR